MNDQTPTQLDKFKALAKELEADEDEARWDERLKKVVEHRLPPKQQQPDDTSET